MLFLSSIFCCFIATCLFWTFNDFFMLLQILSLVFLWHQMLLQGILISHFHLQPFSLHGFSFELIVLDNPRAVSCNGPLSSWRSDRYVFPDNSEGISEGRLKFYHWTISSIKLTNCFTHSNLCMLLTTETCFGHQFYTVPFKD